MGEKYLIDSNVIIEYLAKSLPKEVHIRLSSSLDEEFIISVMNRIEVLGHPDANEEIKDFMDLANTIPLSENIVNQTIQIRKHNKVKVPDAIIAATALVENLTILTRNTKDFEGIPGLKFKNPIKDFD